MFPQLLELPTTLQATLYVRWDFLAIITDITNYFCAVRQMSGLCQAHFPVLNGCQAELITTLVRLSVRLMSSLCEASVPLCTIFCLALVRLITPCFPLCVRFLLGS